MALGEANLHQIRGPGTAKIATASKIEWFLYRANNGENYTLSLYHKYHCVAHVPRLPTPLSDGYYIAHSPKHRREGYLGECYKKKLTAPCLSHPLYSLNGRHGAVGYRRED